MSCRCNNQCSSCGCERNHRPCTPCVRRQLAAANKAILAAEDILSDYIEAYDLDNEDCDADDDCDCGCNSNATCGCNSACGVTHECRHKVSCNICNSGCRRNSCGCWGRA